MKKILLTLAVLLGVVSVAYADTWTKVTSIDDLVFDGEQEYVITCDKYNVAMGGISGTYFLKLENPSTNFSNGKLVTLPDNIVIIKLEGSAQAAKLHIYNATGASQGYLTTTAAKNCSLTETGTDATLTISNGDFGVYFNSTIGYLKYNNSHLRFVTYASGQNNIQIYKKDPKIEDGRTEVTLTFAQGECVATIGEAFVAPKLTCEPEAALTYVEYSSSDENVAQVSNDGSVVFKGAGETTISANIPDANETYYAVPAEYKLTVVDPNAPIVTTLDHTFFNYSTNTYALNTATDSKTGVEYTIVYTYNNNNMSFNLGTSKGSGLVVSACNPKYIIKAISIDFANSSEANGFMVYKKTEAFVAQTGKTDRVKTTGAVLVTTNPVKTNETIIINARAFAVVPSGTKAIPFKSITVTYVKDDGSVDFESEAFKDYVFMTEGATAQLELGEGAPIVTYTSSNENVAKVEGNTIKAVGSGSTTISASWEAVEGKWLDGSAQFKVSVAYQDLASMLAEPEVGETYYANFPVVVACKHGEYHYVTDGKAWGLFFGDFQHEEGNLFKAGWSGEYKLFNQLAELTNINPGDATVDTENKIDVVFREGSDLDVTPNMVNSILILDKVEFTEATPAYKGSATVQYNGSDCAFYNPFSDVASKEAGTYNVKVAVSLYNNEVQFYPIEYMATDEITATPKHVVKEGNYETGDVIEFSEVEEGARILYRHGGDDPSHNNVFLEVATSEQSAANAPRRLPANVTTDLTYNHNTHPLTFNGEEMNVKFVAKKPGKAPSAVQTLSISATGETTGIENVMVEGEGEEVLYNLQGIRVNRAQAGSVYVRVVNGKATKVVK